MKKQRLISRLVAGSMVLLLPVLSPVRLHTTAGSRPGAGQCID